MRELGLRLLAMLQYPTWSDQVSSQTARPLSCVARLTKLRERRGTAERPNRSDALPAANPDVLAGGHNAECRDRRDRTTKVAVDVVHHDLLVLMLQDCPQVGSEVFQGRFSFLRRFGLLAGGVSAPSGARER